MVTVATMFLGTVAVSKTPSPSSRSSRNPKRIFVPTAECFAKQAAVRAAICKVGDTCKPRQRLPQEPQTPPLPAGSPRHFAAGTDESVIMSYYTLKKCVPPKAYSVYTNSKNGGTTPIARNDGVDRISARNVNLSSTKIDNTQRHNEREKESYTNPDIMPERSAFNIHFKTPTDDYGKMSAQMEADKVISTRGLKDDANLYGELIFDINSAYFHNHGGYEFAKKFYADAYRAAAEIVGGEQYILSAVIYADERNRAMSEALGRDVFHYHMHVVYIPVVEKQILWSKRCKDPSLVGTVKETIMQVSSSKKWLSKVALDDGGNPILQKNGKPVLRKSYSVLQDDFFNFMQAAGYDDAERGERGSSEEHLTVTQFKVEQEQRRLEELDAVKSEAQAEIVHLQEEKTDAKNEAKEAKARLDDLAPKLKNMEKLAAQFSDDPEELLPEPGTLETAKSYREKQAKPLLAKIVKVLRSVYHAYLDLVSKFERLQYSYDREVSKNNTLSGRLEDVLSENRVLRNVAENYECVSRAYGPERVAVTVEAVKRQEQAEKEQKRVVKQRHDRVSR